MKPNTTATVNVDPVRLPATARALLAQLEPFGPTVDGTALLFTTAPPSRLLPVLGVLHTGVRAILGSRRWFGCNGATGHVRELHPGDAIPRGITLLAVEGDPRWDRLLYRLTV